MAAVTEVHFNDGLQVIGERAFQYCTALEQVAIPSSVTKLGNHAFQGCNLAEVQLHEGLQVIGERAFDDCAALQQVTIPSSVTKFRYGAFHGCVNLAEVQFGDGLLAIGELPQFVNARHCEV